MSRLALARDRFGRILILGVPGEEDPPVVQRLTPGGAFDPRFGKEGTVRVPLEGATWPAAITVDRRGRPLVATGRAFRLTRLLRNGRVDHGFGDQGQVRTYFGANASPQQVLAAGDSKIVVGGVITRPDGYRIALARYDAR